MSEYAERKPWDLEPHYIKHVNAMTGEGLHSKAAIAAELAYRDKRIEELEKQLAERDAALARLAPKCGECYGTGNVDDAEPGDISFNTFVCPKCGGSGKDLSSLPTSAQATAKVLAAARSFMSLTERWRRDTPTNEFDSLPTDDMYEAIVAAERALREAIREEQEGK